jgi:hypothetical protein
MAAPAVLLIEFALNKVIAHFCNSHWQMASLESIRVEFAQQSRDRFAGRLRVGVLADCADHPSAIDSFPKRPFVGSRRDKCIALPQKYIESDDSNSAFRPLGHTHYRTAWSKE